MNHDHDEHDRPESLDDALRWQLRALRRDTPPARDLWPGIAARLAAPATPAATRSVTPAPRRARWMQPMAMAASVLLVAGAVGWMGSSGFRSAPDVAGPTLVQREAENLTVQYQAALQELGQRDRRDPVAGVVANARVPSSLKPTFEALDRDAALIRRALSRDPDSTLLLEQLRRTYAHRLALTQRLAYT
jgi:hypothetical protein